MGDTGELPCPYCGVEGYLDREGYCCEAQKHVSEWREEAESMRAVIEAAAEALIGDGVEFDHTAIGDELAGYVPDYLLAELPMSADTRAKVQPRIDAHRHGKHDPF